MLLKLERRLLIELQLSPSHKDHSLTTTLDTAAVQSDQPPQVPPQPHPLSAATPKFTHQLPELSESLKSSPTDIKFQLDISSIMDHALNTQHATLEIQFLTVDLLLMVLLMLKELKEYFFRDFGDFLLEIDLFF